MSDLKLESLRIQNFRTFKDLTIDRLGRVNLIVGKNNVGKTALLEGIWLWGHDEFWTDLLSLVKKHFADPEVPDRVLLRQRYEAFKTLFHGWPSLEEVHGQRIRIGSFNESGRILMVEATSKNKSMTGLEPPAFQLSQGKRVREFTLTNKTNGAPFSEKPFSDLSCLFVPSSGLTEGSASALWDEAVRANRKGTVVSAMRVIDEKVTDLSWVNRNEVSYELSGEDLRLKDGSEEQRIPVVGFPNRDEALPLENLGEGSSRLMGIGLGLVNVEEGILLIDEIENGLHYSVQPELWRMIFETAQELDVQVFATTHSFDCIQAFQQVAEDYGSSESMLVSLRRREADPEDIVAVLSDRDELGAVVDADIEVR